MEILLNELSLHEQFNTIDDFTTSLIETIKMYQIMSEIECTVSKKSDLWNYKPIATKTLNEILKIKANDKIRKFKSVLSSIISNKPFWDINVKHKDKYECKYTTQESDYSIAEACERDQLVLSFYLPY